jgi:hypothetical protein
LQTVFSTPNSFKRYERGSVIDQLAKKLDEGVKVRILLITTEDIKQSLAKLVIIHPQRQIAIRELDKSIKTKLTTIMTDRELTPLKDLPTFSCSNNKCLIISWLVLLLFYALSVR